MPHRTPIWFLSFVTFIGFTLFFIASYLALSQPSLGLSLKTGDDGAVTLREDGLAPAEHLKAGWTLERINALPITTITLMEEPDTLGTKAKMDDFFSAQHEIWSALRAGPVTLTGHSPEGPWSTDIQAHPARSFWHLPISFWVQLFSGLVATLVGGWVWSLNPKGTEQIGLFVSGIGLQFSASAAAIYASRELALPEPLFSPLSLLNNMGSLTFGVGLVVVFANYPKRFQRSWLVLPPLLLLFAAATLARTTGVQSLDVAIYLPIVILLLSILGLIAVQFYFARKDVMARAALRVLGLGVVMGAGVFVMTRAIPIILGLETAVSQAILFPLIALFFVSVALSIVRYRLFDMPRWSALILFYFLGACLILAMDLVLVYGLALGEQPSLALSLLCVGFAYLPLRDRVMHFAMHRSFKRSEQSTSLLAMANFIARADTLKQMQDRWETSLTSLFEPLSMDTPVDEISVVRPSLVDFGRALDLPALQNGIPALRLILPKRGQRLFTADDRAKATEVMSLVAELLRGHAAYDIGVETERSRIARDLHDNISIHLLGALHSEDTERKNAFVRETLGNLREIISTDAAAQTDLGLLLNELRFRLAETLDAKNITLDWPVRDLRGIEADAAMAQTVRAVTNEAVTNVIRHSKAQNVAISVKTSPQDLTLTITDDGVGLPEDTTGGNGLNNMRERVTQLGGTAVARGGADGHGLSWVFKIPRTQDVHGARIAST